MRLSRKCHTFALAVSLTVLAIVIFTPEHSNPPTLPLGSRPTEIPPTFDSKRPRTLDKLAKENEVLNERIFPDKNEEPVDYQQPPAAKKKMLTFKQSVRKYRDSKKQIFLATFDSSHAELAFNLYLTSYASLKIINYLFVGTDSNACNLLNSYASVHCFDFEFKESEGSVASEYGSRSFIRKTHYKTQVILDALRLRCTVIIVDVDIVFFKNPLKYLTCESCDIQIQDDSFEGNTGFYLVRPTKASITLHEQALALARNKTDLSNQKTIDRTMESMVKQKRIRIKMLSLEQFPCGSKYFEKRNIMFLGDGNCSECVLVHNNWIVSIEAKIYRFKENGMWQVDSNGYYSDPNRKYLTYDNPVDFGTNRTIKMETEALKIALYLGQLLNRTLILPSFHCHGCKYGACSNIKKRCALNTFYRISTFDKYFKGSYREHVFLNHPKVPDSVKRNQSPFVHIKSKISVAALNIAELLEVKTFIPKDLSTGATNSELISWFRDAYEKYSILRFHSLYGSMSWLRRPIFKNKASESLVSTDYRQY